MHRLSNTVRDYAVLILTAWLMSLPVHAAVKQLLSPEACTDIRRLAPDDFTSLLPLQLSPDGNMVAYILQVPDIASNNNDDELYVRSLNGDSHVDQTPVLIGQFIAAVHWFPDNRSLAVLTRRDDKVVLARVDSVTKTQELIWEAESNITDYSMNAAGNMIAITVRMQDDSTTSTEALRDDKRGYHLDLTATAHSSYPKRRIYILRLANSAHWAVTQQLTLVSPLSGKLLDAFLDTHDLHLSLSPNGRYLLIDNVENFSDVPQTGRWGQSPLVRYMRNRGFEGLLVSYLYDFHTAKASMPLDSPIVREGLWAPDSNSYVKVALAPAGSTWETSDLAKGSPNDHITHLFSVDVHTGTISEVLNRTERAPIAWAIDGDLIVRDPVGNLVSFRKESDRWEQTATTPIPLHDAAPYTPLISDGHNAVMEYENALTPPQLVAFEQPSGHIGTVYRFNPQVDSLILPQSQTVTWTTSTGFTAKGLLLLPPDYDPHRRYPLVIEDGSILYSGEFACDSGAAHVSSFARGILADAGIAYLTRYWPGIDDWESNYYPRGYPGALAEVAFKQDLVESAVKALDERQIIDATKVGLIGFSRGGWYVEYALAHSHIHFQAATATDNMQFSVGEYWYWHNEDMFRALEGMYGGPPYGENLKNWLDYSISFNLDKIRTPLLIEAMGHGKKYQGPDQLPDSLAVHDEVFVGLNRLNKPVELYYYPDEEHQPAHPQARIASLQRNVDWYRFWLQGYERLGTEDPEQYRRWEHLRSLNLNSTGRAVPTTNKARLP